MNTQLTCTKRYDNLPFSHRQHSHEGHCRHIHGHNWSFEFEFAALERDECGFVVDFGGLGELKQWLIETFDHTYLLNEDDPLADAMDAVNKATGRGVTFVKDCSAEGIAQLAWDNAERIVRKLTAGRVKSKRLAAV
jgi:6-pyruvoyltetrahydropterin/6-carboxytetrahydropterin synthase